METGLLPLGIQFYRWLLFESPLISIRGGNPDPKRFIWVNLGKASQLNGSEWVMLKIHNINLGGIRSIYINERVVWVTMVAVSLKHGSALAFPSPVIGFAHFSRMS